MPDVQSLLPPNATSQERALEQATARIGEIPPSVRDMWNPGSCPSALLPWLAWGFGIDQWDSQWTDIQKRTSIKQSIFIKRHKGTIGAVRQALAALGYDLTIQEWFNKLPLGDPYTFDVLVDSGQVGVDDTALAEILSLVEKFKNLRSHLAQVKPSVTTQGGPTFAGALCIGNDLTIPYDSSVPKYSDGSVAFDLMLDASINGLPSTVAALDGIDATVSVTMPNNSWKNQ